MQKPLPNKGIFTMMICQVLCGYCTPWETTCIDINNYISGCNSVNNSWNKSAQGNHIIFRHPVIIHIGLAYVVPECACLYLLKSSLK